MDSATIGQNVRTYRQARGWTQQELARRAMTCHGTVYRVERGLPAQANTIRRLAKALGLKARALEARMQTGDRVESVRRVDSSAA